MRDILKTGSGGRPVYPVFAPEYENLPFVIYQRTGTSRERPMQQPGLGPIGTFQVTVYSTTYSEAREISDSIRKTLDDFTGPYGQPDDNVNVFYAHLVDEADGDPVQFEGESKPSYSAVSIYNIKYEESC